MDLFGKLFGRRPGRSYSAGVTAHIKAGRELMATGQWDLAIGRLTAAANEDDDCAEAFALLGDLFWRQGRHVEAGAMYLRAVTLEPGIPEAQCSLAHALMVMGSLDDALAAIRAAIELKPDFAFAYARLSAIHERRGRFGEALAAAVRAVEIDPTQAFALSRLVYLRRSVCDWSAFETDEARLHQSMRDGAGVYPGIVSIMTASPADQFQNTRAALRDLGLPSPMAAPRKRDHDRIRLGYVSSDFRPHPIAYLTAELFELHDRRRFQVLGYATTPDDGSKIAARIAAGFDRLVRVPASPADLAKRIRDDEIDILIDLNGHTYGGAIQALAMRPAPIQINYLGYPGTMGAPLVDYIVVDPFVVPAAEQPFFSESLVHLPDCYQVNDRKRRIGTARPSRSKLRLPRDGFVFACFNEPRKITPSFFDVWMRLLRAVPGSVLWLLETRPETSANLRREATGRGIDPARLVFAPMIALEEHLARMQAANLFLDTLPYNGHTTMSDALWAGLPAVTCVGDAFPGRVGGSLLRAVGLGELVTTSLSDYEALALSLATDPAKLARIRQRLQENRDSAPLFDTPRFVKHLETAYQRMWDAWRAERRPVPITIER